MGCGGGCAQPKRLAGRARLRFQHNATTPGTIRQIRKPSNEATSTITVTTSSALTYQQAGKSLSVTDRSSCPEGFAAMWGTPGTERPSFAKLVENTQEFRQLAQPRRPGRA